MQHPSLLRESEVDHAFIARNLVLDHNSDQSNCDFFSWPF